MRPAGLAAGLIFAATTLVGCLPFGGPSEPTELFPADSLSREIAARTPTLALELVERIQPDRPAFFASMMLGPDSLIWIGDLSTGSIRRFALDLEERAPVTSARIQFPYVAGRSTGSTYVYDVGTEALLRIDDDQITAEWPLPARAGGAHLSRYAWVLDGYVFVKDTGSGERATIAVSHPGESPVRVQLPGASWRYHGVLRPWNGRMAGTSSFRPVLYFFNRAGEIDSLRLSGFDSPMLARRRAFALGEVTEPPLMISSISGIDDRLFVLNVRPGVLRIDEYDANGMLQRAYERVSPEPDAFTPMDLLVVSGSGDSLAFYVASNWADYEAISLEYRSRIDRLQPG